MLAFFSAFTQGRTKLQGRNKEHQRHQEAGVYESWENVISPKMNRDGLALCGPKGQLAHMWLIQIEMRCKYKTETRFQTLNME